MIYKHAAARRARNLARKPLAILLSVLMVLGSFPTGGLKAYADEFQQEGAAQELAAAPEQQSTDPVEVIEQGEPLEVTPTEPEAAESTQTTPPSQQPSAEVATPTPEPAQSAPATQPQTAPAPEPAPEPLSLAYEDDYLRVTVDAPAGALPDNAWVEVDEIRPVTADKADAYGEALAALSDTLREDDKAYSAAKVYDIRIMTPEGEVEPNGNVTVTFDYKRAQALGSKNDPVEVAHLTNEGDLQLMDASVDTNAQGGVEQAEFTTDSFSYYIVFGTNEGSENEPIHVGDYGWLKFATPTSADDWGHYQSAADLPATNTEEGYHRIIQVRLHTLNAEGTETSYDDSNYTNVVNNEYFWTWENSVYISDFYVPGYEVVQTKMHTAWDDPAEDVQQDSLVGSYNVRGYRSSDGTSSQLNVLDVYMKQISTPEDAMRYIIRYVHADGSVTDGNVRYLASGDTGDIDVNKPRDGEVFSGIAVAAGVEAVTVNNDNKTVKFTYDSKVNLAKAYVYFEKAPEGNTTTEKGRYDKTNGKYYNGEKGLYTDKTAEKLSDRQFMVNLEAWYVDNGASVAMVLDASGSMAWTAGVPTAYEVDADDLDALGISNWRASSVSSPLGLDDVNKLLDVEECDNSNNGYNGYKYYVYTKTVTDSNPINEYAAIGYYDNSKNDNAVSNKTIKLGLSGNYKGKAAIVNSSGTGWYFVNSATDVDDYNSFGAKRFQGLDSKYDYSGANRFYIAKPNTSKPGQETLDPDKYYLFCTFTQGSNNPSVNNQESPIFIKRDQMMTKAETLQDSLAQFGSILNGYSPTSEVCMTRYSYREFYAPDAPLDLLGWTNSSEAIASALDLVPNGTGSSTTSNGTHQYGITGGTVSCRGMEAFKNTYKSHADANDNYKYVILFTDGNDQGADNGGDSRNPSLTTDWISTNLPGYTVITMFMRSVGMEEATANKARKFLITRSSTGKNGDSTTRTTFKTVGSDNNVIDKMGNELFFEATSDNANEVVDQFRKIAQHIVTGLQNYSIRDYIDPRFDVVNDAGDVLTVLDSNGNFTSDTNPDVDKRGFRGFTTPDGKQANLGYDKNKKMFYVIWQNQDIQASAIGSDSEEGTVIPWQSQIRLQAKEDFLGGNDVLTNGNTPTDNLVYKPQTTGEVDANGKPIPQYDANGLEIVDNSGEKKSFPYASVNPALLEIELENYEDTIFLGEEIAPGNLFYKVANATGGVKADRKARAAWVKLSVAKKRAFWSNLSEEQKAYTVSGWTDMSDEDKAALNSQDAADSSTDAYNYAMSAYSDTYKAELSEGRWYINYLSRLGEYLHGDKDFYRSFINTGEVPQTGTQPTTRPVTSVFDKYDPTVETLKVEGDTLTIEIPYYYLQDPDDPSVYAGPNNGAMTDKVGTLKYEWTLHELAENTIIDGTEFSPYDTYVDNATKMNVNKSVQYQLKIAYTPEALAGDAKSGDDGSARTLALTGLPDDGTALIRNVSAGRDDSGNIIYGDNPAFDDEQVQEEGKQTTGDQSGWAVIHAVDGRILTEKKIKTSDLALFDKLGLEGTMTFTLTGEDIGLTTTVNQAADDPDNTDDPSEIELHYVYDTTGATPVRIARDEVVWTQTLDLKTATRTVGTGDDADYTFISIPDNWATGLPQGDYTLTESCTGVLQKQSIKTAPVVFNGDDDPAKPYDSTPASASEWAAPTSGELTISLGKRDGDSNTPGACSYKASTYSYAKVKGDLYTGTYKQTELLGSYNKGRAYLNAQLGHALVTNTLKPTSINIVKTWANDEEPASVNLAVKVTGPGSDDVRYVQLTKAGGWTATLSDIALSETDSYTFEEGLGTVAADGTCADFAAFGSPQEIDGDKYTLLSQAYDDEVPTGVTPEVTPATDKIVANAYPLAGTVTFNNGKVNTTILLKKTNANSGAPLEGAKFVLRDASGNAISGRTEQTTTLTADGTAATVTFENLLPSTTYQIEETFAPAGFERLTSNIEIVVDASGVPTLSAATMAAIPGLQLAASEDEDSTGVYELTVPNPRVYALPAAGGPGAYPFLFAGAFVAAYALSGADDERRRPFGSRACRRAAGLLGGD